MLKSPTKQYDAIFVLGMNIVRDGQSYRPTTYHDYDQYGMLAGEMNILAATLLCKQGITNTFVFCTGTSEKTKARYGSDVPTEAKVYSQDFLDRISVTARPAPAIILEERSVNSYTNLWESIALMKKHGWQRPAILVVRYHIPRVQALWKLLSEKVTVPDVDFLVAEDIVTAAKPGIYDKMIDTAYSSPQGLKRLASEAQGFNDLQSGRYVISEFQLSKQN